MKKFAISLLAALVLMVCVVTVATPNAQAAETTDPVLYHCICGNKHSTDLTGDVVTWKEGTEACYDGCDGVILEWTAFPITASSFEPGNYYLTDNGAIDGKTIRSKVIILGTADANGVFNIDMNGLNLNMNGKFVRSFNVDKQSTLNLCNTKTTGGSVQALGVSSTCE